MKTFKNFLFFIAVGITVFIFVNNVASDVNNIKWHNAGHPPTVNNKITKVVGNYFVSESDSFYVRRDFIEANKYCKICEEKESPLYKVAASLGIIKEQPKILKSKNVFCESDYGITIN